MATSELQRKAADFPLRRDGRYLTPTSRLATWRGASASADGGEVFSTFAYVPRPGEPQTMDERFFLSEANYWLLIPVK